MSRTRINVVVSCTARKTEPAPASTRLRNVVGGSTRARFREWTRRLNEAKVERIRAMDLYCGNAWSVIRRLHQNPETGSHIRLWVVSAGLGLLSPDSLVPPYAATFCRGHADSVLPDNATREQAEEWWYALVGWRHKCGQKLACLADIACAFPDAPLVVAASGEYLMALNTDLEAARMCLRSHDNMVIVSSGSRKTGPLSANFLPCDSRLEHRFGRGRMALNMKILSAVVTEFRERNFSLSKLREYYGSLLKALPKAPYPKRIRMSDDHVRNFIRGQLGKARAGQTTLLRRLRDKGLACEQGRFRELFYEIASQA